MIAFPNDLNVDMRQPINWLHPHSRGLIAEWRSLPGTKGSRRFMDLVNPGPAGNHGTLTNMDPATAYVPGDPRSSGYAVGFNGISNFISIPTFPEVPGVDVSISLRINPVSTSVGQYISDFGGGNEFALLLGFQSGFYNAFGQPYPFGNNPSASQIPASGPGIWDHVVWTKKGATLKGYVNAVEHTSGTITTGDFTPTVGLKIGTSWNESDHAEAKIASYAIHNRDLSPSEIQLAFEQPNAHLTLRNRVFPAAVAAPPGGAIMNQLQGSNLGADLYNGALL